MMICHDRPSRTSITTTTRTSEFRLKDNFRVMEMNQIQEPPTPVFMKPFLSHSTHKFKLPPAIFRKFKKISPGNTTLRIKSGKTWKVELEELENREFWFTNGWNKFVEDVGIQVGQFLMFSYEVENERSIFDVYVFEPNGCENQFENIEPQDSNYPYFEIVLKEHRRSRVNLPKPFAEATGLIGRKSVSLEYPGGINVNDVVVEKRVVNSKQLGNIAVELTMGWSEFRVKNGLVFGKTYSFEFAPNRNVIIVKPTKKMISGTKN